MTLTPSLQKQQSLISWCLEGAKEITEKALKEVIEADHHSSQYVDDSNNIIGTDNRQQMINYTEAYIKLLEECIEIQKNR